MPALGFARGRRGCRERDDYSTRRQGREAARKVQPFIGSSRRDGDFSYGRRWWIRQTGGTRSQGDQTRYRFGLRLRESGQGALLRAAVRTRVALERSTREAPGETNRSRCDN